MDTPPSDSPAAASDADADSRTDVGTDSRIDTDTDSRIDTDTDSQTDIDTAHHYVDRFAVPVCGVDVDPETRCAHYRRDIDVVAFRFGCCDAYYPCFRCHAETTDHDAVPWPRDRFDDPAVLCGRCGKTMSPATYLDADDACPACGAAFNPGCKAHHDRYFEQ